MIVLIGGEKGGTGKTTLATGLAAARAAEGRDVLLVDTDRQGSASGWAAVRDEAGIEPRVACVQKFGKTLGRELQDLAARYDDLVVDAGGRDSVELRAAMVAADRLFVPVQASQFDVWTLEAMNGLVEQAMAFNPELQARVVLNRASTHPSVRESDDAREAVAEFEHLSLCKAVVRDRIAFRKAAREGASVAEAQPADPRARTEFRRFYEEVFG